MNLAVPSTVDTQQAERIARVWQVLDQVLDPEVPALSICDLGIVRAVQPLGDAADGELEIVLTPTYSGCPATELIEHNVLQALEAAGLGPVRARTQRAPAWTTDWISAEGRTKLREYGIAPPVGAAADGSAPVTFHARQPATAAVACPRCGSRDTTQLSAFGSTACKSLYRCLACQEPFEYFKPI